MGVIILGLDFALLPPAFRSNFVQYREEQPFKKRKIVDSFSMFGGVVVAGLFSKRHLGANRRAFENSKRAIRAPRLRALLVHVQGCDNI